MIPTKIPILIVGATGQLGSLITRHALQKDNLEVNILIRNPDKLKDLQEQVISKGGRILIGDTTKVETLKDSTKGFHTVITALIGDEQTVLGGQIALLKDSEANGVKRFLASDFALDYRQLTVEEFPRIQQRIRFRAILAQSTVKPIHILNGSFMETLFYFLKQTRDQEGVYNVEYFGSPDSVLNATTYEDVARFVVKVVADTEASGDFEIIGENTSYNKLSQTYEKVKGKPFVLHHKGDLQEMIKQRDLADQNGQKQKAFYLTYNIPMVDGRGILRNPVHEKYGIQTTSVEEFLKTRPDL